MNTVITIGRQFGSAGREIGEKVADYFGIKCYDKELLSRAAKESGFCEEMLEIMMKDLPIRFIQFGYGYLFLRIQCFPFCRYAYQPQSISGTVRYHQKIAAEGPCVIVGRCADYALSDLKNCVHILFMRMKKQRPSGS